MKVVFTASALADLDAVLSYTAEHFPGVENSVERRIRSVLERLGRFPESGRTVETREGVRTVSVIRYPFRIFYRISGNQIEVLHIHHAARGEP